MSVAGALAEFPLPEVLHFIGHRKGFLRLSEITNLDPLEMELFHGHLCSLIINHQSLNDKREITRQLSRVILEGNGIFEFKSHSEKTPRGPLRLPLNILLMETVIMVDESKKSNAG